MFPTYPRNIEQAECIKFDKLLHFILVRSLMLISQEIRTSEILKEAIIIIKKSEKQINEKQRIS